MKKNNKEKAIQFIIEHIVAEPKNRAINKKVIIQGIKMIENVD